MSTSKNCIRGTHCNSKQQFPKENTSPKTGRPKYSHPTRSCRKPICFDMFLKHRRYAHHIFSKLNDISARFNNSALGSTSFWIWNGLLIWTHSVWTLHHEDIVCGKKTALCACVVVKNWTNTKAWQDLQNCRCFHCMCQRPLPCGYIFEKKLLQKYSDL